MPVRRMDQAGVAALAAALADPARLALYRSKIVTVPGNECLWWTGAVAGRSHREAQTGGGHGRFWFAPGRVIIAHRFAYAVMHGVQALEETRLLGHRCDNPLCQRIAPGHVEPSSVNRLCVVTVMVQVPMAAGMLPPVIVTRSPVLKP